MQRRRSWLFVVFAGTCVLVGVLTRGYTMDDALITLRYARHFAVSGHATWNPPGSEAPRLGYSSMAWMALESLMALVVRDPDGLIVCAKVAAGAALVLMAWLFADRLARGGAPLGACVVFGLLIFANAGHGLNANSGMETELFCAATLLVIWSRDRGHNTLVSYAWAALSVVVRPEGILITPVLAWFDWRQGRKRVMLVGCGLVALTVATAFATLSVAYDSPVPSAFSLKLGAPYPKRFGVLAVGFFAIVCAPTLLAACFLGARRGRPTSHLALAMTGAQLAFFLFVRPIMNEGFRYEWPALYWLAFGAIPVIEDPSMLHRWLRSAIVVVTLVVNARTSIIALNYVRLHDDSDYDVDIGRALSHSLRPGQWLAVVDAGMVPYYADVPTHDALGLADGTAARLEPPYPYSVFCRPDVAVVVVGVGDDDDELFRILNSCGFPRRLDVPLFQCQGHRFAKAAFVRDGVHLDRADLTSRRDFPEWCPSMESDYVGLRSWKTWAWWDGTSAW